MTISGIEHSKAALISSLQATIHRVLSAVTAGADSFALFDFPDHNNVGDSAIYLGELAYLRRERLCAPDYICRADQCDFDRLSERYGDSLILIHGGGNFGDLWSWHHQRREELLERFPGRPIVQLPQSLQFNSATALERTKRVIERHGNFTLLVRDERSYTIARTQFACNVIRCPDMAFYLGPLARRKAPAHELLFLLRDDVERASTVDAAPSLGGLDAVVEDWQMDSKPVRAARKLLALATTLVESPKRVLASDDFRAAYFGNLAATRVERGLTLLSSGGHVVTDRLHAYILALLLDIPCSVIDNSYGKLSGFIDTWMSGPDRVKTHASIEGTLEAWRLLEPAAS